MKKLFMALVATLGLLYTVSSCSSDSKSSTPAGKGNIDIEFDQVFGDADLILNTQTNATSQSEDLKISTVKYIVSNIVLEKADGSTYTYPKADSYFIVDEANEASHVLSLSNIPAGDYTKIHFGIGVDKAQWDLGLSGQGDLYTNADAADMVWSWAAGYKFVAFEGTFTSATVTSDTSFMVHTGKTSDTAYNYEEVTLDFPNAAQVRTDVTPDVHIYANVAKIIDGHHTIKLEDHNGMGMGAMIMGGDILTDIMHNVSEMFRVDHVHND
ncbi:hypothetical protein KIH23_00185 [Flavobacterium sp. CYK-55]|uniref:MbnP family protein n=1 Tax=Flavobacterium sp. CYK-55 TaxID=2835529 RepID=UPI001BCEB5F6|nr:MbnP family protein [Flavobacterium sp. CYK-55]MBS7785699.1 hypothetical protein [Flavobacterium sp. CYK-55]